MKTETATIKRLCVCIAATALAFVLSVTSVLAWFGPWRDLAVYAPISTPETLLMGAGHCDQDAAEGIGYLYFDTGEEVGNQFIMERVFCIYGRLGRGSHYKIQLAYTTNNQFTYSLYRAEEKTQAQYTALGSPDGFLEYKIHDNADEALRTAYYYSKVDYDTSDEISITPISGTYLNKQSGVGVSEDLGETSDSYHDMTYGTYNSSTGEYGDVYNNVNKYAEPIYWQMGGSGIEIGANGFFSHYFILRIEKTGTESSPPRHTKETDIICISATVL